MPWKVQPAALAVLELCCSHAGNKDALIGSVSNIEVQKGTVRSTAAHVPLLLRSITRQDIATFKLIRAGSILNQLVGVLPDERLVSSNLQTSLQPSSPESMYQFFIGWSSLEDNSHEF